MLFFLRRAQDGEVPKETIVSRIRARVAEAIQTGKFENEAEFLRTARLSTGYFGELEQRCAKNPEATLRQNTASRIAKALGITVAHLVGDDEPEAPLVDRYPNRAWAVMAARNLDLPEAAIQVVLKQNPGRDLPKVAWYRRIESEAESLRPASRPPR